MPMLIFTIGVQSFVATPTNPSTTPPLIVWPHGGPHTAFTANFITWVECLTVLGYSVLLGRCGTLYFLCAVIIIIY